MPESKAPEATKKPNIIVMMVDDLGYSDLGCYGGEISTPNIDALGYNGLRFTQMYNGARCCPSRAALLTGLHPHQAGIGQMTTDLGVPSYQGYLREGCVTIAEVMKTAGYRTMISGKWHVSGSWDNRDRDNWILGDKKHPLPKQRGFDRSFGLLNAADSFWNPKSLILEDVLIDVETNDFHMTDAIGDHAVNQIEESVEMGMPFFQYVAFTAPHWPLHAWEDDIVKYEGNYMAGYDAIRTSRHEQQKGLGVVDDKWEISPRDSDSPDWDDVQNKEYEDIRMATYCAMIEQVDRTVGRIVDSVKKAGEFENTVIMFLSDNGGCAELFQEDSDWPDPSQWASSTTLDGEPVRVGDIPELRPGPDTTFQAVELPWANVSDAPFRLFKRWVHEGGISTPFIVHWPDGIEKSNILNNPMHIIDISATCYDIAGAQYPKEHHDTEITPLEGESFLPALKGRELKREQPITIEHEGNRGIRVGDWKLVAEWDKSWELYNISDDRTEQNDLIDGEKDRAKALEKAYFEWAERAEVLPWPVDPRVLAKRLKGDHAHISQHRAAKDGIWK
ncbi:MAG: arylsulfatase [Chloroflexi bacterium]|jgi:arylsulfatase|nr:arylsulfatase [Chloroflexota bacterium]